MVIGSIGIVAAISAISAIGGDIDWPGLELWHTTNDRDMLEISTKNMVVIICATLENGCMVINDGLEECYISIIDRYWGLMTKSHDLYFEDF